MGRLSGFLEENSKLAPAERIRIVSVSAAPSGPGSFVGGRKEWDAASQRAEAAGMVVLGLDSLYCQLWCRHLACIP